MTPEELAKFAEDIVRRNPDTPQPRDDEKGAEYTLPDIKNLVATAFIKSPFYGPVFLLIEYLDDPNKQLIFFKDGSGIELSLRPLPEGEAERIARDWINNERRN